MDAFIAMNKYIVREVLASGAGVPVAFDENIAKAETCRRKDVASKNQWMLIDVPERDTYLDTMRPMAEQSDIVAKALRENKFLCTLFIDEAHQFLNSLTPAGTNTNDLTEQCQALLQEKYDFLMGMKSGQALIDFMTGRCVKKDRAKVSALLWTAGITGTIYNDQKGERLLIFNAQEDIYPLATRDGIVPNTPLIA